MLIYIAGAGFFPVSASVYKKYQARVRRARLEEEQKFLAPKYRDTNGGTSLATYYDDVQNFYSYSWHVALTTLVSSLGITLFLFPKWLSTLQADLNTLTAVRYGFLGAYVFSLHFIYRRYTTSDLQPSVYMHCNFTLIAGLAFNYIAFEAFQAIVNAPKDATAAVIGVGAGLSAILAFSLGYFPYLAIQWFNRVALSALGGNQYRADALPLGLLDGISAWHEVRLRDNGIDNVQNLASAEIHDLVINTNFDLQQVVDWVDQALLYLHLDQSAIESLRRTGIRTLSDFQSLWKGLYVDPSEPSDTQEAKNTRRRDIGNQLHVTPEILDMLYKSTGNGPNIDYVRNYFKTTSFSVRQIQPQESMSGSKTQVTVRGAGFKDGMAVKLVQGDKEIPAQEIRFVNSDQVDCIFHLPPITQTEIWDVVVTGSYTQVDTLDGRFKIVPPAL